jgi:hypothetical protein
MVECDVLPRAVIESGDDPDYPLAVEIRDIAGGRWVFRATRDALTADGRIKARCTGARTHPVGVVIHARDEYTPEQTEGIDYWWIIVPAEAVQKIGRDSDPARPKGRKRIFAEPRP